MSGDVNLASKAIGTRAMLAGAIVAGALLLVCSGSAPAQQSAPSPPSSIDERPLAAPMMLVPYPIEVDIPIEVAPGVPYASCYRIGRCSLRDLYRYSDKPNRLTRLAPEPPPESVIGSGWTAYRWVFVPITPNENIHPRYRGVGEVRSEYATVGTPIDEGN